MFRLKLSPHLLGVEKLLSLCRRLHLAHFVFSRHTRRLAHAVFHVRVQRIIAHSSSASRAPGIVRRAGRAGPEDPAAEEEDGLQLAVAAPPHAQADGGGGGGEHGEPPHGVAREGARVEACEEQVEEVDCEGEVGDEFAARDEDDHGERPGDENKMLVSLSLREKGRENGCWGEDVETHMQKPPLRIHTKAMSHPCVVSPRT
jgi:hypothetical protein